MSYVDKIPKPPRTLTELEQRLLLKVTGEHRAGYRDHVAIATALGTALREHELLGLDVGDIYTADGKTRRRVQLRVFKRSNPDPNAQQILLPDSLRAKLERFRIWKKREGESVAPDAPLFLSRRKRRLSARQLRERFRQWQERAGFERHVGFHILRHSSCSRVYRQNRDIRVTQKFARHKSITSTAIYAHPTDEDLLRAIRDLPC